MKKIFSFLTAILFVGSMWGVEYELVNSTDDLVAGAKYVIGSAASTSGVFMATTENTNNRRATEAIAITEGKITATSDVLILELGGSTGAWTFLTTNYAGTDGYLTSAATGKNNYCLVQTTAEDCSYFTISFSDNAAVITSTGRSERNILRFNTNLFACYTSGQAPVYLFKEVVTTDPSISITGSGNFGTVDKDEDKSVEFTLSGAYLQEGTLNISVTGGYTVTPTSISVNNAGELASNKVTVSKNSTTIGSNPGTLKIYGAGVTEEKASTVSLTMTIGDKFVVSFSTGTNNPTVNDIEEASVGAGITLPAGPTPVTAGWSFVGWAETAVAEKTTAMPTLLAVGSKYTPTADVTIYAVYKKIEGASETSGTITITHNSTNFPTAYGDANTFTEYTLEGYKFKIQQIYKNNGKMQWRASGNAAGTGTIYNTQTFPEKISSIVLTYDGSDSNKNHTLKVGASENPTEGTEITGTKNGNVQTFDCSSANADYFVMANGTGAGYTASLAIHYGNVGTTYYVSSPYDVPTAIDNTEVGVKAIKVLREGQIFILRGEKVYTVQGQLVK